MTLNTLTARIGIEKKKRRSLKVAQPDTTAESSSHVQYLKEALEAIKSGDIGRIDSANYKKDIKRILRKRE
jgi:hypothetical protein